MEDFTGHSSSIAYMAMDLLFRNEVIGITVVNLIESRSKLAEDPKFRWK